jgi:RHS repeat-associated protein
MTVDFGYTGLYYHQPSGLNLALYREYSPSLGRWISRDPITTLAAVVVKRSYSYNPPPTTMPFRVGGVIPYYLPPDSSADFVTGGVNLYEYVLADPINLIDPLGLKHCCPADVEAAQHDCSLAEIAAGLGAVAVVSSCGPLVAAPELAFWEAFNCVGLVHSEIVLAAVAWEECHKCDNQ